MELSTLKMVDKDTSEILMRCAECAAYYTTSGVYISKASRTGNYRYPTGNEEETSERRLSQARRKRKEEE